MSAPLWLVIPTYNEADGIDGLVRAVHAELQRATSRHRILIVDDASPDGTGEIADRLSMEIEEVEVLHRPGKAGLGRAYRAGFAVALRGGAEVIVQMDADFSHEPSYLPGMLRALEGADLVLGSRYVAGGGVTDWGPARRALSRGGCLYARLVLRVPVRDMTGGFKVIRREVLEAIDLATVGSQGYGFQIETTYRALKAGFRVSEVPIVFSDRREGSSKMSAQIAFEAMRLVPRLRRSRRGGSPTVSRR